MNWSEMPLARATVDRAAERRTDPDLVAHLRADPTTRVVLVRGATVATVGASASASASAGAGGGVRLDLLEPDDADGLDPAEEGWLFLGADADHGYLARVLPDPRPEPVPPAEPADMEGFWPPQADEDPAAAARAERIAAREWSHLRTVGAAMPARDAGLGTTAVALAAWHRSHRCCPRCGTPTVVGQAGWVRSCPADGRDQYPRTDPAVIMAVVDDDDRLLLGHASHWPERRFSTLAGYVEPGEGLEQAVRREVDEEVSVAIGEVTYRGSQPWPFPASLMLAFVARATTTDITVDGAEVTEARWFTRAELAAAAGSGEVLLPSRTSIARALIEEWAGAPLPGE
ncbi:NAD(+) diphosphatase [Cellulomonas sp. ATA003]|uniref:NAD(+) diphosphatase n=1 Tax=Cellulomonas sp. ATA003 TaxID=3073064 RepID=UPI002873E223|nr:NAD(+) diphosphatase [Cellulomonas sp. ATA003]WNB86128.1 NAD(+) diphosphatase [Cellulomonas sp. ATA003]